MPLRHSALNILVFAALLAGCATHVEVVGNFPVPVTRRLPVSMTLVLEQDFRNYRFAVSEPREVSLAVGAPQAELFETVTRAMFKDVEITDSLPPSATTDLILVPRVEQAQIATPPETRLKVFEVWVRYRLALYDNTGQPVADWTLPAYGRTPTRVLTSDSEALNQASVTALRDAGASLITGFTRAPGVGTWLAAHAALPAGEQASP
jgi:hypothetical protein